MKDDVHVVRFVEVLSVKVGRWFVDKGFVIADENGHPCPLVEGAYIGILDRKDLSEKRHFIGMLWFKGHGSVDADPEHWVFEIYGRNLVDAVRSLAALMVREFSVDITIRLVGEDSRLESEPNVA